MSNPKAILDFTDKPIQKKIFHDRSQVVGAFGGFNAGKSYVIAAKVNLYLSTMPESVALMGRKTYNALEKSFLVTYLDITSRLNGGSLNEGPLIKKWNASNMELTYRNGSKAWFTTYDDVKKVRGPNISFAVISQAEEVAYEIYLELLGRIRFWNPETIKDFKEKYGEQLKEQLGYIPTPFNQLLCEGNPAPNWVRDEFRDNKSGLNSCYVLPSAENKKFHADGWLDRITKSYSKEWYNRYVLGSWDSFGGQIYTEFDMEGLHGVQAFKVPMHWPRIIGWDAGYKNPTAVLVAAVDEMGNVVFYKEHYRDNLRVGEHAAAFKTMAEDDNFPKGANGSYLVVMDYGAKNDNGGDNKTIWEQYADLGIYGLNSEKDVMAGIQMVKSYLVPDPERPFPKWHPRAGQLGSPKMFIVNHACPNLVNEKKLYMWEQQKEGAEKNAKETPRKWLDHACDAERYMLMYLGKRKADWIPEPQTPEQRMEEITKALVQHAFTRDEDEEGDDE